LLLMPPPLLPLSPMPPLSPALIQRRLEPLSRALRRPERAEMLRRPPPGLPIGLLLLLLLELLLLLQSLLLLLQLIFEQQMLACRS
jgi:hypothetical protein